VFEHVWFAYTPAAEGHEPDWVLRDVSFDVKPGERVGIVGATGSGKTTLINLLLRFYDVNRGRITIDGVDVRELELADVRGLFSLVLQDVHLFSGTIADNIRLGNQALDAATLVAVASRAAGPLLRSAQVVDRYEGAPLPEGRVSLTLALKYQDPLRTLKSEEVELSVQNVIAALREQGAEIRGE
jgi:ABC-type multidrug transport system fused ATPase/permease subunit